MDPLIQIEHKRLKSSEGNPYIFPAYFHRGPDNGIILINFPGADGDIDGYNNKYVKIADLITDQGIANVLRLSNKHVPGAVWENVIQEVLQHTIEYIHENNQSLTGSKDPIIYLAGVSAGASAAASVSSLYPSIKKVLLISPSADAGWDAIESGLFNYQNELYITAGEKDIFIGMDMAPRYEKVAVNASKKELIVVPECDHLFRGTVNGNKFSHAYLWAFANVSDYPSGSKGIELY